MALPVPEPARLLVAAVTAMTVAGCGVAPRTWTTAGPSVPTRP